MSLRLDKVNKEIQRAISDIIRSDIDDPIMDFVSITRVKVSPDLRQARVYFSILDQSKFERVKEILDHMAKFIRVGLGQRVRLKVTPQLIFAVDNAIQYSVDIYKKIEDIREIDREKESSSRTEEKDAE